MILSINNFSPCTSADIFREFAQCVLERLGYDVGDHFMDPSGQEHAPEDLTFHWSEEDYQEFLEELKEYTDKD